MGRHAYLIIAHKLDYTLEKLMECLDDKRNDIFLHMDRKNKEFSLSTLSEKIKMANLYEVLPRLDVTWGETV